MYFDELKLDMTVDIKPAVINKEKMVAFAHDYDNSVACRRGICKEYSVWKIDCTRRDVFYVGKFIEYNICDS